MESNRTKVIFNDDLQVRRIHSGYKMLVRRACNAALMLEHYPSAGRVEVVFTDRERLKAASAQCPFTAEVFAVRPCDDALGRIYISVRDMEALAKMHNRTSDCELAYITFKGVLIMLGYSDGTPIERAKLLERIEWMMYRFGLPITTKYALLQYA